MIKLRAHYLASIPMILCQTEKRKGGVNKGEIMSGCS